MAGAGAAASRFHRRYHRDSPDAVCLSRRHFLRALAGAGAAVTVAQPALAAAASAPRRLAFVHTHTSETLDIDYADLAGYVPAALQRVNEFLRDFRTDEVHAIDPTLLDLLHALARRARADEPFHVISGYRSPRTNHALRSKSSGVARYSLHMEGKAIDIRIPDVKLATLRDTARLLRRGGVGYYPDSGFVHVDTGRVRTW